MSPGVSARRWRKRDEASAVNTSSKDSNCPPMLPGPALPASWRALLDAFRPAFRRPRTFALFAVLSTGLITQTARRTVVGMLTGAGAAAVVSFHTACRFFSHHGWEPDRIGLALARLIVDRLLAGDTAIEVVR